VIRTLDLRIRNLSIPNGFHQRFHRVNITFTPRNREKHYTKTSHGFTIYFVVYPKLAFPILGMYPERFSPSILRPSARPLDCALTHSESGKPFRSDNRPKGRNTRTLGRSRRQLSATSAPTSSWQGQSGIAAESSTSPRVTPP